MCRLTSLLASSDSGEPTTWSLLVTNGMHGMSSSLTFVFSIVRLNSDLTYIRDQEPHSLGVFQLQIFRGRRKLLLSDHSSTV